MMARRGVMGVLASAAALVLVGCAKRGRLRYRITVEVETLGGLKIECCKTCPFESGQGHHLC